MRKGDRCADHQPHGNTDARTLTGANGIPNFRANAGADQVADGFADDAPNKRADAVAHDVPYAGPDKLSNTGADTTPVL